MCQLSLPSPWNVFLQFRWCATTSLLVKADVHFQEFSKLFNLATINISLYTLTITLKIYI